MPSLANCLSERSNIDIDLSLLPMSEELGISLSETRRLVTLFGAGFIYAPGGHVYRDTPNNRNRRLMEYGKCVIIDAKGSVIVDYRQSVERKLKAKERKERWAKSQEIADRKRETCCRRMFHDGQTFGGKKRQGKGQPNQSTWAGLGQYVFRVQRKGPQAVTIFQAIKIPNP